MSARESVIERSDQVAHSEQERVRENRVSECVYEREKRAVSVFVWERCIYASGRKGAAQRREEKSEEGVRDRRVRGRQESAR